MAKAKYGGGIQDLRGAIAGQVHSRNTFGNYVRQKVSPVQPRSARQQEIRSNVAELSQRYSTQLSDTQLEAWRQAAASNTVRDVFGDTMTLTGINLYVKLNSVRALVNLAPLDDPPAPEELQTPLANITWNGTVLNVNFSNVSPTQYLAVWLTKPLPPGRAFVQQELRLLELIPGTATSPVDITGAYEMRFGTISPGSKIWLSARTVSPRGWQSQPVVDSERT